LDAPTLHNMTWRYAVTRETGPDGNDLFAIRELYEIDGKLSWTDEAVGPSGNSFEQLKQDLAHMVGDAELPLLDLTVDPPTFRE
jgi:hypothetical protein